MTTLNVLEHTTGSAWWTVFVSSHQTGVNFVQSNHLNHPHFFFSPPLFFKLFFFAIWILLRSQVIFLYKFIFKNKIVIGTLIEISLVLVNWRVLFILSCICCSVSWRQGNHHAIINLVGMTMIIQRKQFVQLQSNGGNQEDISHPSAQCW